ncbi:molybdopterin-dependent oxidoreductase [Jidongwangia harbinensis]|uniref:molybdopterin-dependent oxidoreductase n=1 Tax=Jidongwangia harbinensis TaxID=2878561 RepID=UPI001CDA16A2|nr:molybdopterin-dependent oxidoreductase [Jidongwangia harbinensis]MCA2213487.1 molybdopterin-dependent oxidoreductase [Jidongwangia harbinensis]
MRRLGVGAAAGVLSAAFGTAAAELLAAAVRPEAGPLVAVGGAVIDATPTPVKEFAVRQLGTYDKPVLLGSIVLVLVVFTAVVGMLATGRRVAAVAGAVIFGAAGATAALSRPAAAPFDAVPSLFGAAVAGTVLLLVLRRALAPSNPDAQADPDAQAGPEARPGRGAPTRVLVDRRAFLQAASLVAAGAAAAGGGAAVTGRARGGALAASREAVRLPAATDPAAPLPAGTGPGFVTANADFYRVDTALALPRIDVDSWSLRVHGMVEQPVELSFADLLERPLIERHITLNCVSNEVGGPYVGTARWLGVPLAPLLRELGVRPGADQLVARSTEGMTIGTPVSTVLDGRDTMLCVGMNGEPLPIVHGFPVRMLTPGLYGYAGACKWLAELELTTFADFDAYWVRRGWGARGPVKTASRIDRPRPFARLTAGRTTVAGVAWAQGRGIAKVEIRVDDGDWAAAELLPVPSVDTWVQWRYEWPAGAGPHVLTVRATDGTGAVQVEQRATPFPDGATGQHGITVTVA